MGIDLYSHQFGIWKMALKRTVAIMLPSNCSLYPRLCNTPEYDKLKAREVGMDAKFQLLRVTKIRPPIVLPEDFRCMIREKLQNPDDAVLISKFSIDFCRKDLATLCPSRWLNDEVINFYFQLINSRSEKSQGSLPFIHVFTSFFYPKMRDRGYEAVRASTRRLMPSVLSRDMILFPIHLGSHWCLAVIDFQEKTISYYDSLHGRNEQCLKSLRNWLAMESRDKLQVEFDFAGWQERCCNDIPSQRNGYDCGVFTLVFAEHISRRAAFSFSQADMVYWRDRISYEILVGTLLI